MSNTYHDLLKLKAEVLREDCGLGWEAIARELGVRRHTVKRWLVPEYRERCLIRDRKIDRRRIRTDKYRERKLRYYHEKDKYQVKTRLAAINNAAEKSGHAPCSATVADVEFQYWLQESKCAICEAPENGRRLHIDHCHETGKFRGLLCHACNMGIGAVDKNPEAVKTYLRI